MAGTISHIHARQAALYVDIAAITFDAATSLDQEASGASIFKVKNLTIIPPSSDVELINLWGSDVLDTLGSAVPTTGTFQIQALDQKSWTLAKVTFIAVLSHDELGSTTPSTGDSIETLFHGATPIDITDSPAFTRYVYGDEVTSPRITIGTFIFVWNNGSGIKNCCMNKLIVTKMGDIKPTGADGHWEQDIEAVCLAKDFMLEPED